MRTSIGGWVVSAALAHEQAARLDAESAQFPRAEAVWRRGLADEWRLLAARMVRLAEKEEEEEEE